MKYIDAEKLITEKKKKKSLFSTEKEKEGLSKTDSLSLGARIASLEETIVLINALQQEQESVAERFAKIVRGNLIGIDEEVQQKFENLYLEVTGNKMYGGYND